MTARVPLTLYQGNAATLDLTITPDVTGDDLTGVTGVEVIVKDGACVDDAAAGVTHLTSSDAAQVQITSQTASRITARAYLPAAVTTPPYERWWRVDALVGAARRTAAYGPVTIIDL